MIKDLLVHVDDTPRADARLDLAIPLARRFEAHLTGIYGTDPQTWMPGVGFEGGAQILALIEETEAARMAVAKAKFVGRNAGAMLQTEWRTVRGWPAGRLALHARYAGLVVLGQAGVDEQPPGHLLPGDVGIGAGRPALVVPGLGRKETVGARRWAAGDGSGGPARAVADAMPFLRRAALVSVMTVEPRGAAGDDADPVAPAAHLARHGIRAEARRETA